MTNYDSYNSWQVVILNLAVIIINRWRAAACSIQLATCRCCCPVPAAFLQRNHSCLHGAHVFRHEHAPLRLQSQSEVAIRNGRSFSANHSAPCWRGAFTRRGLSAVSRVEGMDTLLLYRLHELLKVTFVVSFLWNAVLSLFLRISVVFLHKTPLEPVLKHTAASF